MSSPNSNPQLQGWQTHRNQQSPLQQPDQHHEQASPQQHFQDSLCYEYYAPQPEQYVQSLYGGTSRIPIIAELPAPLPPTPPTTTSEEQLKQDELLAHDMQQLELEEVRKRSSSVVSPHRRPVSMKPPIPQRFTPLLHQQRSAQSLRPHSQSVGSFTDQRLVSMVSLSNRQLTPSVRMHQPSTHSLRPHSQSVGTVADFWSPESVQPPPPNPDSFSSLPEVVVVHPVSHYDTTRPSEDLPIPVLQDQWPSTLPSIALEPSSLPTYLEQHYQAPYPPQWSPPPVLSTLYAYQDSKPASGVSWLDTPESCAWRTIRPSEHAHNPIPPAYAFKYKTTTSSFRSPKFSWTMTCPEQPTDAMNKLAKARQTNWTYDLKFDPKTNMRKSEVLTYAGQKAKAILTTYVHALNYDSLRFIGPDGCAYIWVSSTKVSSIKGSRYDTLRHALFVATRNIANPLYGDIVADHCFWDGFVNESEKSVLPDEALYVRSSTVDPALVVATLQVLKDWEKHALKEEKRMNLTAFLATEKEARNSELGKISYWST